GPARAHRLHRRRTTSPRLAAALPHSHRPHPSNPRPPQAPRPPDHRRHALLRPAVARHSGQKTAEDAVDVSASGAARGTYYAAASARWRVTDVRSAAAGGYAGADRGFAMTKNSTQSLRPQVILLGLISLLNDASSALIYPLLPIFLTTTLGATPVVIGIIDGLVDGLSSIHKLVVGA